jgi:hypothetical protein
MNLSSSQKTQNRLRVNWRKKELKTSKDEKQGKTRMPTSLHEGTSKNRKIYKDKFQAEYVKIKGHDVYLSKIRGMYNIVKQR